MKAGSHWSKYIIIFINTPNILCFNTKACKYLCTKFSLHRIGIDEWLRVPSVQDIFSIGDCSGFVESTGKPTLPALAQVTYIGFISFSNAHFHFLNSCQCVGLVLV